MCKEDVRIKRKTACNAVTVTPSIAIASAGMPARPDRVALHIGISVGSPAFAGQSVVFRGGPRESDPVLCALGGSVLTYTLTVEKHGVLVTLPVFASDPSDSGITWTVTEVYFNEALSDV